MHPAARLGLCNPTLGCYDEIPDLPLVIGAARQHRLDVRVLLHQLARAVQAVLKSYDTMPPPKPLNRSLVSNQERHGAEARLSQVVGKQEAYASRPKYVKSSYC